MRATLLFLSLFGLLFVTGCNGSITNTVLDAEGKEVGSIQIENENNATIVNMEKKTVGKVRGNVVRDAGSKKLGTVESRDNHVVIVDADDNEVGSLENGIECRSKAGTIIGTIGAKLDPEASAAACLVLLIQE